MTFLFLYAELAGYTVACLNELSKRNHKIIVVRWPVNNEAPFAFNFDKSIEVLDRTKLSVPEIPTLIKNNNPDVLLGCGWLDKGYLKAIKANKQIKNRVIILDNQWRGDLKQQIATLISPFWIRKIYNKAWVPGLKQQKFALKLGFNPKNTKLNFYSADVDLYQQVFEKSIGQKQENFPKRFLFVGRYVDFKGVEELWGAFNELTEIEKNGWELWCAGTGILFNEKPNLPNVKHLGFVQPEKMLEIIAQCGVFIMPSRVEPWGVVLHEMATAGMPIITTTKVGAAENFLIKNKNGYLIEPNNKDTLKEKMLQFINMSKTDLVKMAEESNQIGKKVNPKLWADTLESFVD